MAARSHGSRARAASVREREHAEPVVGDDRGLAPVRARLPGRLAAGLRRDASGVRRRRRRLAGDVSLPAGNYEYKAALNNSWDENYGLHAQPNGSNVPLDLPSSTNVKFYYDHKTHWITDNHNSVIAVAAGKLPVRARLPERLGSELPSLVAAGSGRRRHLHVRDDGTAQGLVRGEGRDQRELGRELRRGRCA
jgi:hypothetical protein